MLRRAFIQALKHCDAKEFTAAAEELRYDGRGEKLSDEDYKSHLAMFEKVTTILDDINNPVTHRRGTGRVDTQVALYSTRQLEQILTESYDEEFAELRLAMGDLVPMEGDLNPGAKTWTYYVYTTAGGLAQIMAGYSSGDMPIVDVQGVEVTHSIIWWERGYAYSVKELAHAAFAGDNLDARAASAAKRSHMERWQITGLWGREDLGLNGLLNHPNITVSDAALNGAAASTHWVDKTPTEIIADVNTLINTVDELSFGIERVTRVVISRAEYNLIKTTQLSSGNDGTNTTILDYLRKIWNDEGQTVEFQVLNELAAAQSDGNLAENAMFAYPHNNSRKLSFKVAQDYTQEAIQQEKMHLLVPAWSAFGGIKLTAPLSCHRMDSIGPA